MLGSTFLLLLKGFLCWGTFLLLLKYVFVIIKGVSVLGVRFCYY